MYRVIIVDDENTIRKGIIQLIPWHELDCRVVFDCKNGQEVLDYLSKNQADIIVSDIQMPVMDGIKLISHLKESYPHLKNIILTAHSEFTYAQKALRYGACDFIIKNDFITELPTAIKRLISQLKLDRKSQTGLALEQSAQETKRSTAYILESLALGRQLANANGIKEYHLDHYFYCICSGEICLLDQRYKDSDVIRNMINLINITITSLKYYIINLKNNTLSIIFYGDREVELSIKDIMIAMSEVLHVSEEFMRIHLKFGISSITQQTDQLPLIYRQSREALFQISESGNMLQIYTDNGKPANGSHQMSDYAEDLSGLLLSDQCDQALAVLIKMKNFAVSQRLSLTTVQISVINLFSMLLRRIAEKYLWSDNSHTEAQIYEQISDCTTIYSLFSLCEEHLLGLSQLLEDPKMEKHYLVHAVDQYIQDHYTENITLQAISDHIHVSPSYISRLYKIKKEQSITTAINQLRIKKAKELLDDPAYKIYEVAIKVGIEDAGYFASLFTKYEGCSPSDYRGSGK